MFDSSVPNQFSDGINLGNLFFSLVPDLLFLHLDLHFSSLSHHFFETFQAFFQLFLRDVRASVSIALLEETIGEILDLIGSGWHSWWTHVLTHWSWNTLPRAITCAGIVCSPLNTRLWIWALHVSWVCVSSTCWWGMWALHRITSWHVTTSGCSWASWSGGWCGGWCGCSCDRNTLPSALLMCCTSSLRNDHPISIH